MKEKKYGLMKAGVLTSLCVLGISLLLILSYTSPEIPNVPGRVMRYKEIGLDWLGTYSGTASGVNESFVYAHQNLPNTIYNVNISNTSASCYAHSFYNDTHGGSNVPYSTVFDILVMVRWNVTHAWNGTAFDPTYTRGYCNCTLLGVTGVLMNQTLIGSDATYVWYMYYLQDSDGGATGSGFTISKGQNITSCSFNFEAYY